MTIKSCWTDLCKYKLSITSNVAEKASTLTIAPESWGRRKIAGFFNVGEKLAAKSKTLLRTLGFLPYPRKKIGNRVDAYTEWRVHEFYTDSDVSTELAAQRNVRGGKQLRLLLFNSSELWALFERTIVNEDHLGKIKRSKFLQMKPREFIYPGSKR